MDQVKLTGEIHGFDRVLYESRAQWGNFILSEVFNGSATFEIWADGINAIDKIKNTIDALNEQVERFILSIEWSYGHELSYTVNNIEIPPFASDITLIQIENSIRSQDNASIESSPRKIPHKIPQVPLEAKRWIQTWVESQKLSDYVEEQLRRQYLIIEELWQDLHYIFDESKKNEKQSIKLIRDFVSHAHCDNHELFLLVENDLPSALYKTEDGKTRVRFNRTTEHRNYISRFEVKSRQMACALVEEKMKQLGIVSAA